MQRRHSSGFPGAFYRFCFLWRSYCSFSCVDRPVMQRDRRAAILAVVVELQGADGFSAHFVTQLRVKLHGFFRARLVSGEAALPTFGGKRGVGLKLVAGEQTTAGVFE